MSSFPFACILVGSILAVATIASHTLSAWRPNSETFRKVKIIVKSWWIIAAPFLVALSVPKWGMIVLFILLSTLFAIEYTRVSKNPFKRYLLFALLVSAAAQYGALAAGSLVAFLAVIPVVALWSLPWLVISRATIADLQVVVASVFGGSFAIYYLSHIPALTAMPERLGLSVEQSTMACLVLLLLTWSNDVFQFISGKSFGERKIVPQVSPNKTLAGFIGGVVCTTILAIITLRPLLGLSWEMTLALGPLLSIAGMFGDLFFSAVKRNIGVKDFSKLLPGHGGILDRVDSLVFTAPLFFHFLLIVNGGWT